MHTPERHTASTPAKQAAARDAHPRGAAQRLHRRYGNQRTQAILQAKLNVGSVDDPYEREADRIAGLAMRSPDQHAPEAIGHVHGATGGAADPAVADAVARASARGGGRAVPSEVRGRMERVSGADLREVRVHVDAEADRLNDALGSRAFTVGPDIFVRPSEYRPGTAHGDALLSHELTHTVQQGAAPRTTQAPKATRMVQRVEEKPTDERRMIRIKAETLVYHGTTMTAAKDIIENGIKNGKNLWAGGDPKALAGALGSGFYTYRDRTKALNWGMTRNPHGGALLTLKVKSSMYGFQATQQEEFKRDQLENTPVWTQSLAVGHDEDELLFRNGARDLEFVGVETFGFTDGSGAAVNIPAQTTYWELEKLLYQALEQ